MSDYEMMRSQLDSLSEDQFCEIRFVLGYDLLETDDHIVEWVAEGGGAGHIDLPKDS